MRFRLSGLAFLLMVCALAFSGQPAAAQDSCEKPGRFESVERGVTLHLRHHSIRYGFSLYYFLAGRYQELPVGD